MYKKHETCTKRVLETAEIKLEQIPKLLQLDVTRGSNRFTKIGSMHVVQE